MPDYTHVLAVVTAISAGLLLYSNWRTTKIDLIAKDLEICEKSASEHLKKLTSIESKYEDCTGKIVQCQLDKKDLEIVTAAYDTVKHSAASYEKSYKECATSLAHFREACLRNLTDQEKDALVKINEREIEILKEQLAKAVTSESTQEALAMDNVVAWEERRLKDDTYVELDQLRRKLRELGRIDCEDGFVDWRDKDHEAKVLMQLDEIRQFAMLGDNVKGLGILRGIEDLLADLCSLNERLVETQLSAWETRVNERYWQNMYQRTRVKQIAKG